MTTRGPLTAITLLLLSYCGSASSDTCELIDGNLLQDPMFQKEKSAAGHEHWSGAQHSGEPSFELTFDKGELTINKTGTQPWFYFRQIVAAEELAGKKLALNVELKLDLREPSKAQSLTTGGGVSMTARSSSMQGGRLLLRSILDHEPRLGTTDWFPVQVVIELPKQSGTLEVGFLHQADGVLQLRNPSLQLVDESSRPCAVSPNAILSIPRSNSELKSRAGPQSWGLK